MANRNVAEYDPWAEFYDLTNLGLPGEAEFYVGQAVRCEGETLELGCGTGRIAIPMAMTGVRVTGLDNSQAMLDRCRAKKRAVGPVPGKLKLVKADMRNFDLGKTFEFIAAPYRALMHLLTPGDQQACLQCVHRHLADNGRFIFNCWNPLPSQVATMTGVQAGMLRYVGTHRQPGLSLSLRHFCAMTCDEIHQTLSEQHVIHVVNPKGRVTRTEVLALERAWMSPRETANLVRLCCFEVEAVFGDFDCNPLSPTSTEMIWVLRRM